MKELSAEDDGERPKLEPDGDGWRLADDWHTDCNGVLPDRLTLPKGFVTDGASVPRFLWWICGTPMDVPRIYAAIVHDWLYDAPHQIPVGFDANGKMVWKDATREDADRIFRDYQIALGISRFKAWTEYYAVRAFAWGHWWE